MRIGIKELLIIVSSPIIAYAAFVQYQKISLHNFLADELKACAVLVTNQGERDLSPDRNTTFSEVLSRINSDITDIEKMRNSMRIQETKKNESVIGPVDKQLKNSQDLLRAISSKIRSEAALLGAVDSHKRAMSVLVDAVLTPEFDYANKRTESTKNDAELAKNKYDSSYVEIQSTLNELAYSNSVLSKTFSPDVLIDRIFLNRLTIAHLKPRLSVTFGSP